MEFVVDTHALVWHLSQPKKLGSAARNILAETDDGQHIVHVPAVVVAEALMVAEKGRLAGFTKAGLLSQLNVMRGSKNFPLTPLTPDIVVASAGFTMVPDIFDRLIVTEAVEKGLPVISKDPVVSSSGLVGMVWD